MGRVFTEIEKARLMVTVIGCAAVSVVALAACAVAAMKDGSSPWSWLALGVAVSSSTIGARAVIIALVGWEPVKVEPSPWLMRWVNSR